MVEIHIETQLTLMGHNLIPTPINKITTALTTTITTATLNIITATILTKTTIITIISIIILTKITQIISITITRTHKITISTIQLIKRTISTTQLRNSIHSIIKPFSLILNPQIFQHTIQIIKLIIKQLMGLINLPAPHLSLLLHQKPQRQIHMPIY